MKNPGVHFSSDRLDWETPHELFQKLDSVFGFDVDLCADTRNSKCEKFYSVYNSAFDNLPWRSESNWMNPPYGRGIGAWIEGASVSNCVCLLPARVETKWFQTVWEKASAVCFIRGRLKFVGAKSCAPFPSCIAVFGHDITGVRKAVLESIGYTVRWGL